ncbi:integrase/recombinase [Methanohalophilus levihalophilus]|nr:integrase/recombinase [Methanohalophilus levihalophilus]
MLKYHWQKCAKKQIVPGGFEPPSSAPKARAFSSAEATLNVLNYTFEREKFTRWIHGRVSEGTAKCYVKYLDQHLRGTEISDIDSLLDVSMGVDKGWNWYAKAVRNLINYYVEKRMISAYFAAELKNTLKIRKCGTDTYVPSDELVCNVFQRTTDEEMQYLIQLVYYSGIRIVEAVKVLTEFDPKKMHYENGIAYYDIDWERGQKKAFKAFMPEAFARQLYKMYIDIEASRIYFRRRGLGLKYGRNFFIDKCVKAGIQESFIKYMVGHSNGSVLMTNYLDKLNNCILNYGKVVPYIDSAFGD